ncbi:MAG: hypothetical protein KGZ96_12255 [Clostridia bacterium]|nr:hypothetical protein [Clostridia bacterium]
MNTAKRYYSKHVDFFRLINKMKLWPSRKGILHGVKSFKEMGVNAELITHCNETIIIKNSRNSRAARWLRNKWFAGSCNKCKIPQWKIDKYATTVFNKRWGSQLIEKK